MTLFVAIHNRLESIATFFVELSGNGYDPEGSLLPSFAPPAKPPTAKVPRKETPKDKGGDWVGWDGQRIHNTASNAVELDNYGDYGITEREYGEMRAYNPPLLDLELASKVKSGKANGESLADIAKKTRKGLSLVKHYSAALYRANDYSG